MKKLNIGYLGLLGIPLALLGIVTSVSMAAPVTPTSTQTATEQVSDSDTEINDDDSIAGTETDTEAPGAPETNDDADGPQESPETEVAD